MRQAIFKVSLTKESDEQVLVDYATVDGTAKSPEDYTPVSGTLTFLPGQLVKNISVMVREEIPGALPEAFTVRLTNPRKGQMGRQAGTLDFGKGPELYVNGPLIKKGLLTNAYHKETGRGDYFHEYSGTSEGQSIAIEGAFLAYAALKDGTAEEKIAASWWKQIAQKMLDAMGDGKATGPMLRQPFPKDVNTITLLHWLFAARGDIPEQAINYEFRAKASGGKITIPQYVDGVAKGGEDVYRIWQIFPATSQLLYTSPYSPTYDRQNPTADTSVIIDKEPVTSENGGNGWVRDGKTVVLTVPTGAPAADEWIVVYGYRNAGIIKQGEAEEAYPNWTKIEDGYAACAPDTFRWFEYAMTIAAQYDDRAGMTARWTMLRNAMRRTAVRGQNINDLREIIKPMPNFPAIPARGEPAGMFCYSNNPNAGEPPAEVLDKGGSKDWIGFRFFSREGGEGKSTLTADDLSVWTPDKAFDTLSVPDADQPKAPGSVKFDWRANALNDSVPYRKFVNGSVRVDAPTTGPDTYATYEVQMGRGQNDVWRAATPYQDADQFLLVVSAGDFSQGDSGNLKSPRKYAFAPMQLRYFISLTKNYDPSQRYIAHSAVTTTLENYDIDPWAEIPHLNIKGRVPYSNIQNIKHLTVYPYRVNSMRLDKGNYSVNQPDFVYATLKFGANIQANQYNKTAFTGGATIMYELIPIEAFQRMDKPYAYPKTTTKWDDQHFPYVEFESLPAPAAADVLPRGKTIENFGVIWNPLSKPQDDSGPLTSNFNVIYMRLLSGPSKEWVMNNLEKAIHGSKMPFFPGAMPFAINADTKNQAFVGFNGNPFHGYQLPDYWYFLQADAEAVLPGINPVTDLPTASLTGAVEYPIAAKTTDNVTKPAHALLAEQQLLFLKRAQEKWLADGGPDGVFAHTFVLNTPARATIGNPNPHTWVYTNDDPNTRWLGYQVRVVESIARLAYLARSDAGWKTSVSLSVTMAMKWLTMLNVQWPNLNGKPYNDPQMGAVTIYGMPSDYDDPAKGGIQTKYEEPHGAAIVLRATIWLKLSGQLTAPQTTTVNAIATRCWNYLKMRYRTGADDSMRYTWAISNATTDEQYYGFWHFEIITTICHLLSNPTAMPAGVTVAELRTILVNTQKWTQSKTE